MPNRQGAVGDMPQSSAVTVPETPRRLLPLSPPFDLARTVAPAWWARGRWPNVDARSGAFVWVGWEAGQVAWRSVRQIDAQTPRNLRVSQRRPRRALGSGRPRHERRDAEYSMIPIMAALARKHAGLRPWSAGSLFEGVVSSIVGQSISVAAAATTERRLCERFNKGLHLDGRQFWPPPLTRATGFQQRGVCPRIGRDHETSRGARCRRNAIRVRAGFGSVRCRSSRGCGTPGIHFRDWAMDRAIGTLVGHRGP